MVDLGPYFVVALVCGLGALMVSVIWPPFAFGLLLTIPVLKVVFRKAAGGLLTGYTYDMAVVMLAIIGAAIHRARQPNRHPLPIPGYVITAWLVIIMLMWVRLPASGFIEYGFKKTVIFSIFNTCTVASVLLMFVTPGDGRRMLRMFVFSGVVASLAMLVFGSATAEYKGARVSISGASPLGVADLAANAVIILLCAWIADRSSARLLKVVTLVPLCTLAIFMSGTRGPIFTIPVVLPVVFWLYRRRLNFQAVIVAMIGFGLIVLVTAYVLNPDYLTRFTGAGLDRGLSHRMTMFTTTIEGFLANPILGNGPGDTSVQLFGPSHEGSYPHNHLLEVANELGIFGLAAWLTIMIAALRSGVELSKPEWEGTEAKFTGVAIYACFLYYFIASFKAGSYSANYMTYFYAIATIAAYELRRRDRAIWQSQFFQFVTSQARAAQPADRVPARLSAQGR